MQVSQYAYFALRSPTKTAAYVAERLGIEPDRILIRGSRVPERDVPRTHSWGVECAASGMTVDEQVAVLLERLRPVVGEIVELRRECPDMEAVLQVVRNFDDPDGADEEQTPPGLGYQKLAGQHQLLGWHLDRAVLDFLHVTGAELDVDEYG